MSRLPLPVKLQTERLLLQRVKYEDAEEIFYAYASKPEATRYVTWPTHRSIEDTRDFLRHAVAAWELGIDYSYTVRLRNGMLIGGIGALNHDGKIQFGYIFSPVHWGNGYATEACRSLLSELKPLSDIYRIHTFVDVANEASIKVLRKCGLVEEAVLPKWFRFANQNNEPRDCILFRLKP
jgi:ribosomal-protein-alanine N-acetyltransferase